MGKQCWAGPHHSSKYGRTWCPKFKLEKCYETNLNPLMAYKYSVINVENPISEITITREQSWNLKIRLCEKAEDPHKFAPMVKFPPKLEIWVNPSKVGKRLAYWPIAALQFRIF